VGILEPERTSIARQRLGSQFLAATTEELLEVFYVLCADYSFFCHIVSVEE
jgi:hypothetical protein